MNHHNHTNIHSPVIGFAPYSEKSQDYPDNLNTDIVPTTYCETQTNVVEQFDNESETEALRTKLWLYLVPDVYTIQDEELSKEFNQLVDWKNKYEKQPITAFWKWFVIQNHHVVAFLFAVFMLIGLTSSGVLAIINLFADNHDINLFQSIAIFILGAISLVISISLWHKVICLIVSWVRDMFNIGSLPLSKFMDVNELLKNHEPFNYFGRTDIPLYELLGVYPELAEKLIFKKTNPKFKLNEEEFNNLVINVHDANPNFNTQNEFETHRKHVRKRYMQSNQLTLNELQILVDAHHKLTTLKAKGIPQKHIEIKVRKFIDEQTELLGLGNEEEFQLLHNELKQHLNQVFGNTMVVAADTKPNLIDEFNHFTVKDTWALVLFKQKNGFQILEDIGNMLKHNPNITMLPYDNHYSLIKEELLNSAEFKKDNHPLLNFLLWISVLQQKLIDDISNEVMEVNHD